MRETARLTWQDIVRWLTAFAVSLVVAASILGNQVHAQGNDAVFSQNLVDRALRFGGSYYDNGIHPKGPLEEVAHDIARRIGGYDGHWYVISFMIAISAAILGVAAARTTMATRGNRPVAVAVALVVFIHFALGDAAYSGLLYSRNILVTLLAIAWVLTLEDRPWTASPRVQMTAAISTGVVLGLAVQTIIPAAIDAASIGIAALVLVSERVPDAARRKTLRRATILGAVGGFVSAPVWYLVSGSFRSFWASWWVYARDQNSAIGLSLAQQLSKGWHTAYSYYQHRPLLFVVLGVFVAYTFVAWRDFDRRTRVIHVALLGWLAGGWIQLVMSERYSDHYFSVVAAPTAMIAAALAGHACPALWKWANVRRFAVAIPLVALLLAFFLSAGTAHRLVDSASITSGFTSAARGAELRRENQPPTNRSIQAVLDLVSADQDPLLLFDGNQFLYGDYRRIPATRFQQNYFLTGSIYLGRSSPKYVPAGAAKLFAHDMLQANPAAFLKTGDVNSPIVSDWVDTRFQPVFDNKNGTVELRTDVADSVLHGPAPTPWTAAAAPDTDQGWTVGDGHASFVKGTRDIAQDRLALTGSDCTRIDGVADGGAGSTPGVVFHVVDSTGKDPEAGIALDGATATARGGDGGTLESQPTGAAAGQPVPFSLVVGSRAAVLVVNGKVVAAVRTPAHAKVLVESMRSGLSLTDLKVGPANIGSGCPSS